MGQYTSKVEKFPFELFIERMILNLEVLNNNKDCEGHMFDEYMWFISSNYNNIDKWIKERKTPLLTFKRLSNRSVLK